MIRKEEIEQAAMQVGGVHPDWDALECFRVGYKEGAQWADKTMIEKACQWLESALQSYLGYYGSADFTDTFRKAMQNE